jgi:hypothetical protein
MHKNTKIATCCYCGTRAALVLDGARHELTCSSCGAPLHNLKQVPKAKVNSGHHDFVRNAKYTSEPKPKHAKKPKKRKSLKRRFFEEAFDVLGDLLD